VRELVVKTGEVLPDLQLYSDEIAFCNAAGGEVNHAEVGSTVTVKVRLKNGYRAAMTGPIDVCLCDGWVTENDFLTFSSAHSNVLACASIHDGMDCGETVELDIPWTVGSDRAGVDLGYGKGSRPITLVAVSRNNVEELRLNNNLTSRLFAIGTEEDLDIMRISITGAATWSEGGISLVSGKCWYSYKGEDKPAIGCPVQLSIDGTGVGGNRIYTLAPDGTFSLFVHSPRAGMHTLTAEATDGTMRCSTEMPFKSAPMTADYRPNLYVKSLVASGSGIYKHTKDMEIVHRGGAVVLTAEIVNNGHIATESAFDVQLMVRDNGDKKEWENVGTAVRIASGFAVGAATNLSFVVPDWITKGIATRHLCVYADNKNEVAESNESWVDNSKECLIAVREGPDLDPGQPFVRPNSLVCGETLSFECSVRNNGLVSADTPFSIDVCIDDQVVVRRRVTDAIMPGCACQLTVELGTGDLAPGYHSVSLHADSEGEVTELSEENNWSSTGIEVFPAEPELSLRAQDIAWSPAGDPVAGRTYTFSAKISNAYYTIAATNAVVSFSILEGGEYVSLGDVTVKELARNGNVVVSAPTDYAATRGFHVVKVSVRSADGVDQMPSNNEATTSFDVEVPLAVVDDNAFVNAVAGVPIELDGSKSKHGKYFAWTILDRPQDSSPVLSGSTQNVASFTPDIIGRYELQFCVRDDEFQGEPVKVVVDVTRVFIDAVGTCGTLTPSGRVIYEKNATPTYTFEPWVMYALENVVLDNQTLANATATYDFAPLDRSHKLSFDAVCIYPGDIVASDDGTFTLVPRNTVDTLDISSFPANVAAENVTVAVKPGFKTVRLPKGAHIKIVTEGNGQQYDITKYVDCAGTDSNGHTVWNVAEAKLKDTDGAISRSLDLTPESGAIFNPSATNPITTANTIKGLTYTLHESTTVDGLRSDSAKRYTKVGDGDPWTPEVSTERGDSGFYTLSVSK